VNVIWALFNMVVGYFLFRAGRIASGEPMALGVFLVGIAAISIMLSVNFTKKDRE
jgi:hypothetical protein